MPAYCAPKRVACGCGHLVSAEPTFIPSRHPREDIVATLEQRIAAARAEAELEGRRTHAKWERIILEEIFAAAVERVPHPSVECPCCSCSFDPDEYRQHVVNAPAWCNRERWGSEDGVDDPALPGA